MPVSDSNLIFRSGLPPFASVVRLISCRIYNFVIGGPNHTPFPLSRLQLFCERPFFEIRRAVVTTDPESLISLWTFSIRDTTLDRTKFGKPTIRRRKIS